MWERYGVSVEKCVGEVRRDVGVRRNGRGDVESVWNECGEVCWGVGGGEERGMGDVGKVRGDGG